MQEAELPASSVAMHVTVVVPGSKFISSCGLQLTFGVGSKLSDTIGFGYSTGLVVTRLPGQVIIGSMLSKQIYKNKSFYVCALPNFYPGISWYKNTFFYEGEHMQKAENMTFKKSTTVNNRFVNLATVMNVDVLFT